MSAKLQGDTLESALERDQANKLETYEASLSDQRPELNLTFHSDAGHGWLKVPRDIMLLVPIDILKKVSACSYQSFSGDIYLEEDCDANLIMQFLETRFRVEIESIYDGDRSNIRRMNRWSLVNL